MQKITILFVIFISTLIPLALHNMIQPIEDQLYKLHFRKQKNKEDKILIVYIDENTIKYAGHYPLLRHEYGEVINKILEGNPRVLGIDIFFDGIRQFEDDKKLLDVLNKSQSNVVLAIYPDELNNFLINQVKAQAKYYFNNKKVELGNINILDMHPNSGVTRIYANFISDTHSAGEVMPFPIIISSLYNSTDIKLETKSGRFFIGDIEIPLVNNTFYVNYWGDINAFERISFENVLNSDPNIFKDKIVLIGNIAETEKDYFKTPISTKMPGVVVHANAIHTILSSDFIKVMSPFIYILVNFILCCMLSIIIIRSTPKFSLLLLSVFILSILITAVLLFHGFRYYIHSLYFIITLLFCYFGVFMITRRSRMKTPYSQEGKP